MKKIVVSLVAITLLTMSAFAGNGIAGAKVELVSKPGGQVLETVTTGADGTVSFKNKVPQGDYLLRVHRTSTTMEYEEIAFTYHTVVSPRDAASGQATGKRQHKPITVTKEWGAKTPAACKGMVTVDDGAVSFTYQKITWTDK